jgi:hypothetical protein
MLLLSSKDRQQRRSTVSYKPSSSPSFWIAQAVGAVLVCPPDVIERWLPMVAPFPTTVHESKRRTIVNRILEECWDNIDDPNGNSGYEIQATDEWIVDNQRQNRKKQETKNYGEREEKPQSEFRSQELSRAESGHRQDTTSTSIATAKSGDSLFSNYFLSLHLLFSLPSIGEENEDEIVDITSDGVSSERKRNIMSPLAMKPSTYGEITPLGTRQLFGAMGLLDRIPDPFAAHFVDLGSGTGKVVGQAVLELSSTIDRATGVELSPSRHESATRAKQALIKWLHRRQPNDKVDSDWYSSTSSTSISSSSSRSSMEVNTIDKKLELIEGDLFDVDLSTATHIYIASLCFPDNLMIRLEEALCQRIARQHHHRDQDQTRNGNDTDDDTNDTAGEVAKLQWIATLRKFPNDLGGIQPIIRFMEMSWTSPLGCTVYLYRCDTRT